MILQVWNFIKSTPSLQKLVSQAWHGESSARWLLLSFLICHLWFNPHQTVLVSWPRGSTKCNWCEGSVTPSRCASRTGDLPTFQIWRTRFLEVAQLVVQPHLSCTDSSWSSVWGPQACGTELSRSCGLQPTQAASWELTFLKHWLLTHGLPRQTHAFTWKSHWRMKSTIFWLVKYLSK
jgi:hypothetical protein